MQVYQYHILDRTYKGLTYREIPEEKDSDNMADAMPRKMEFKGAIGFAVMK